MQDIAKAAGVGKATVSLALRNDPRLRPQTCRRIQKIARQMGYRTNATIASLMALPPRASDRLPPVPLLENGALDVSP